MRGLVVNEIGACKRCGLWHHFLTVRCRPLVMPTSSWNAPTVPWRWSMLLWTNWWGQPWNSHVVAPLRRWRCRHFGHDYVVPDTAPGEHRVMSCRRCWVAVDLEPDDVIARDGRAIFHVGK